MTRRQSVLLLSAAALPAATPRFHFSPALHRPYLHPLATPSGVVVSRNVPPNPGEDTGHSWHRGLWYGHGDICGVDFWREPANQENGRILVHPAPTITATAIDALCSLSTPAGSVIGACRQQFKFSTSNTANIIDAAITLIANGPTDLVMGDTDDGGLAVRLTTAFEEKQGALLQNSEGAKGTAQLWGKPARWVDYSATVNGKPAGVVILDHPSNLRHPTRWHARGYGLNSANPFAIGSFTKSRNKEGNHTIPRGSQLTLRYRIVIYDGPPSASHYSAPTN